MSSRWSRPSRKALLFLSKNREDDPGDYGVVPPIPSKGPRYRPWAEANAANAGRATATRNSPTRTLVSTVMFTTVYPSY